MAMSIESAIEQAIFGVVLPAYAGPASEFVCRVWPGQPISASQYGNAWSPTNTNGRQAATENLSMLVDPVPNLAGKYSKSGGMVEDTYQRVVTFGHAKSRFGGKAAALSTAGAAPAAALPGSVANEITDSAETEVETPDGKMVRVIAMTSDVQSRLELARKKANQMALARALAVIQAGPVGPDIPIPPPNLSLQTNDVTNSREGGSLMQTDMPSRLVEPTPLPADPPSITSAFYKARTMFERSFLASLNNPPLQYHPSIVSPEDWTDKAAAQEDWPFITIPVQFENSQFKLSIRFSRVDIFRPWFVMSLFNLPDWAMSQDEPAGSLSNGKSENNAGSFPLLPQSLIVARDIKAVDTSGTTLFQANGLQILAWINRVIPFSPY
jgi:hypothetical protein